MGENRLSVHLSLGLTQTQRQKIQENLCQEWNEVLKDVLAFTPSELRASLTSEDALSSNQNFGDSSTKYLIEELRSFSKDGRQGRIDAEKKIVAVGYGKGFDSNWIGEAVLSGLCTLWADVSNFACDNASQDIAKQYEALEQKDVKEPAVEEAEIHNLLLNPEEFGISPADVEVWYLSRVLGCIRKVKIARAVLELLGRALSLSFDPNYEHRVVLVTALRDDNPHRVGLTSKLYSKRVILKYLERGALRKIKVAREVRFDYFDQHYTAMTIVAVKPNSEGE